MTARSNQHAILVVDDSIDTLEVLRRNLEGAGYRVFCAGGVPQALALLEKESVAVVVTDLKMPGISGIELVRHVRSNRKDVEVLMITAYPSVEGAVEAMKTGAADYLPKPFTMTELAAAVAKAVERRAARQLVGASADLDPNEGMGPGGMIGVSAGMRGLFRTIKEQASKSTPLVIRGEWGTGRKMAARAIHEAGMGADEPLYRIDGGSALSWIPGEKTGTLLITDVDRLSADQQRRLLARLDAASCPRVIATSTLDPGDLARRGILLEPLVQRVRAAEVAIEPLRERVEDIPHLVRGFLRRAAAETGRPRPEPSGRTLDALMSYDWPGNVEELWWTIRRIVAKGGLETIEVPDLPPPMRFSAWAGVPPDRPLEEVELAYIQEVLASVEGNRTRAAEILGIDRKTLREKLRRAESSATPG